MNVPPPSCAQLSLVCTLAAVAMQENPKYIRDLTFQATLV
jgi:hypothetical protein